MQKTMPHIEYGGGAAPSQGSGFWDRYWTGAFFCSTFLSPGFLELELELALELGVEAEGFTTPWLLVSLSISLSESDSESEKSSTSSTSRVEV